MDSHIQGKAANGHGAVVGTRGLRTKFGTNTAGRRLLLQTQGATVAEPIIVELLQVSVIAFNGTAPQVAIVSENLDGSGDTNEFVLADITPGQPWATRMITADKRYWVEYTLATGGPTAGEVFSFARISGRGETS